MYVRAEARTLQGGKTYLRGPQGPGVYGTAALRKAFPRLDRVLVGTKIENWVNGVLVLWEEQWICTRVLAAYERYCG
jgi:hypothetical protein